ncbi:MAG: DNA polymerase III subunit alpha [Bacteroidales bacterium]|nr:DNA polymerase III subunit alpha [Bacteroidales bacterium]
MPEFTHLHLHTQYSLLDGASSVPKLIKRVKESGMKSVAITDHGNMFGVKSFHKTAIKEGVKPILGCEVYVAKESRFRRDKEKDKKSDHLIILAKNQIGYQNLIKLVSYGYMEGFYRKPRIDMEILEKYSEGLIVSSACLAGSVPRAIMNDNINEAEKQALKYKEIFGEDYYLEMQRHETGNPEKDKKTLFLQELVNKEIVKISEKTGIKYIATNDVHFINKEDAAAHDILIALSTGKDLDDPTRMQYSGEEYLKTPEQMSELFAEYPDAITNTKEIEDKIETYDLNREPIMPEFQLPENFKSEAEYLKHVTYEGAKKRWTDLTDEIKERIDFELDTIIGMGFPGYFLIVWDFLKAAREMGVSVGPGRGSAAGSVVAYSLEITDIDPLEYGLLFERFLNPDRISMPDIDIDFDEDGREKILDWVVEKYGEKRVANIITFGSMAAKSSIRDVARVLRLPLQEADRIAKLIPERPGITLEKAFKEVEELKKELDSEDPLIRKTLNFAQILEGSVRHTGVHACGIIIGKDDLENYVPLSNAKDSKLKATQYDGKHVEDIGLLKMDFLGLKTLSIIMDALKNIKHSAGVELDIDNIPLNDEKTFNLYAKGETTGVFQFESDGMKKHLKNLKPNRFEDLIAMNALYRPGPMEYIPDFIARKHGKQHIVYDLPEMEELLKETYGITVYQEQVMLLSQKLAGFTKGQADSLRKAMGKKIISMMEELKVKFFDGCKANGHDEKKVTKIWTDWEKFASYAFNKSHSTCYAYIAYQTAYLKAHYPAEFMSAILGRNLNDIKKVSFFLTETKRMGIEVLLPDVNESFSMFIVNKKGQIRYGLGGIKNVGGAAVDDIIKERERNGKYKSFIDFIERVNLSSVNKRTIEALVTAGAFDDVDNLKRNQYFKSNNGSDLTYIEECIKFGGKFQNGGVENQASIFGEETIEIKRPEAPQAEEWSRLHRLKLEKEIIGIYLSEHPLDAYKLEIGTYCNTEVSQLADLPSLKGKEINIAGIITEVFNGTTKTGKAYGSITLEGYSSSHRIYLFGKDYITFKNYFTKDLSVLIRGRVQPRYKPKDDNDVEFKINEIELLSEAKDKMIKALTITVPLENISDTFIENIIELTEKYKGKTMLNINVVEKEKGFSLNLFSRSKHIKVNQMLLSDLNKMIDINIKLN